MSKNYAIFPAKNIRITQNYDGYSHYSQSHSSNGIKSYPLDIASAGLKLIAPCRMKSVKMNGFYNESVLNQVFFQSTEKVNFLNGEYDYITILAGHTDDWDYTQAQIGTVYERGQEMLDMGSDGVTIDNTHLDIVIAAGLQNGWVQNSYGEWVLPNSRKWEDVVYIDPKYNTIIDTNGITFKNIPSEYELPKTVLRDESKNQIQVTVDDLNVRKGPGSKNEITFFPCVKGIYDYTEVSNGWYKIKDDMWINEIGLTFLPKKVEVIVEPIIEEPIVNEPIVETPIENEPETPQEETIEDGQANTPTDTETTKNDTNNEEKKHNVIVSFITVIFKIISEILKGGK